MYIIRERRKIMPINQNILVVRIIEESQKLPHVVQLADYHFISGLREDDINWGMMAKNIPSGPLLQFRNRLRDLETGFRKPGEKEKE
jgi:hypothetical protein